MKKQDEQKLIDKLIDMLQYDLNLDDEITKRYKEHFIKKEKEIYEKQIKLDSLEKEKDIICKDIETIEHSDEEDLDMVEYLRYTDEIKEKKMTYEFEKLFG